MNLKDLAAKPQLTKITIDDEDIVSQYGEPLDFYTWDRQPMDVFLKVATSDRTDFPQLAMVLKDLVLDADGEPVMKDGMVLPSKVLVATFTKMVSSLGK
jgi:hypothetical protein